MVTVLIGDLATLLGCVMDINGSITAITIVALGTSLPDTFASKVAAVEDPTADAAIGNVTGSNSVNVFLGLGLPWVIGTIYWKVNGRNAEWIYRYPEQHIDYPSSEYPAYLVVLAGDLSFSVGCFTLCAISVLCVLWYRRRAFEAELGGPVGVKTNTSIFLVLLWVFYVSMASWKVIEGDVSTGKCVMAILVGIGCVASGMMIVAGAINYAGYWKQARRAEMKELLEEIQEAHDQAIGVVPVEVATQPRILKGGQRVSLGGSGGAGGKHVGFNGLDKAEKRTEGSILPGAEEILAAAPALAGGLLLKPAEAVATLRKHVEALNVVCCALEGQVKEGAIDGEGIEGEQPSKKGGWGRNRPETPLSNDGGIGFEEEGENDEEKKNMKTRQSTGVKKKRLKKKNPDGLAPNASETLNEDENQELLDSLAEDAQ